MKALPRGRRGHVIYGHPPMGKTPAPVCRDYVGLALLYHLWAYISEIPLSLPQCQSGEERT
jgi:hypothetical protein